MFMQVLCSVARESHEEHFASSKEYSTPCNVLKDWHMLQNVHVIDNETKGDQMPIVRI